MISLWIEIVAGHPQQSDRCQITGRAQRYRKIIGKPSEDMVFPMVFRQFRASTHVPDTRGCLATISIHRDIIYITRFKTVFSTDEYFTMKKLEKYLSPWHKTHSESIGIGDESLDSEGF